MVKNKKGQNDEQNKKINNDNDSDNEDTEVISILRLLLKQQEQNQKLMQTMMSNSMKENFDVQIGSMSKDVFSLHSRLDALEIENKLLKKRVEESDAKIVMLEQKLGKSNDDIDEVEQYVRRSCLVINNLPSEQNKTDEQVFIKMCEEKFRNKFEQCVNPQEKLMA